MSNAETVWSFKTDRFEIRWEVEPDYGYRYDGEDEDGSIQDDLDAGVLVAFDSKMSVYLDGAEIASDHLCGSVYRAEDIKSFRDHIGMNARGHGSYFSDMVRAAIAEARQHLAATKPAPRLRAA